jgi:hypothetical protein
MNRRLNMFSENHSIRRQKTADTRIFNSRKLPHDFFGNHQRTMTPSSMKHEQHSDFFPSVNKPFRKL